MSMTMINEHLHQRRSLANIYGSGKQLSGGLEEIRSLSVRDQSQRQYQINMKFSCGVLLDETILHQGSSFRNVVVLPEIEFNLLVCPRTISALEEPRYQQLFKGMVSQRLNLSENDDDLFSDEGFQSAVELLSSAFPDQKIFNVEFKLSLVHSYVLVPRTSIDGQILLDRVREENAAADGPCRMIPATEESIRTLKRKRVEDDGEDDCVICLEGFAKGSEAVSMPCAHSFHGDCIEEWLRTSHYCPICRYKMPTRN